MRDLNAGNLTGLPGCPFCPEVVTGGGDDGIKAAKSTNQFSAAALLAAIIQAVQDLKRALGHPPWNYVPGTRQHSEAEAELDDASGRVTYLAHAENIESIKAAYERGEELPGQVVGALEQLSKLRGFRAHLGQSEGTRLLKRCDLFLATVPSSFGPPQPSREKPDAPPLFKGKGLYIRGDDAVRLDGAEAIVMETLVKLRAATKPQLEQNSGVDDAVRILRAIKNKYRWLAPYIILPGTKGRGGYRTTVQQEPD